MTYIDGVLAAVPAANKEKFLAHAEKSATVFKRHGAIGVTECWGDDIPEGKTNSLHTAVLRKPDEVVVMSWISWPDKAARDAGWQKVMEDPDMANNEMPFDGARLIYGGFDVIMER